MAPENAIEQFANTYKEWHYLVGGFSMGFLVGTVLMAVYEYVRQRRRMS